MILIALKTEGFQRQAQNLSVFSGTRNQPECLRAGIHYPILGCPTQKVSKCGKVFGCGSKNNDPTSHCERGSKTTVITVLGSKID